jgi:hypothetical protein
MGVCVGLGVGIAVGGVALSGSPQAMVNAITMIAEKPITRIKKPPHGQVAKVLTTLPSHTGPFGGVGAPC